MPPCISANSFCPSSLGMHFNLTPLSLLLYSSLSTNWYILDCLVIFSISSGSSGSSPVCRKRTICCAHAGARGSTASTKGMKAAAGTPASTARTSGSAGAGDPPASLPGQSLSGTPASTGQILGSAGADCSSAFRLLIRLPEQGLSGTSASTGRILGSAGAGCPSSFRLLICLPEQGLSGAPASTGRILGSAGAGCPPAPCSPTWRAKDVGVDGVPREHLWGRSPFRCPVRGAEGARRADRGEHTGGLPRFGPRWTRKTLLLLGCIELGSSES